MMSAQHISIPSTIHPPSRRRSRRIERVAQPPRYERAQLRPSVPAEARQHAVLNEIGGTRDGPDGRLPPLRQATRAGMDSAVVSSRTTPPRSSKWRTTEHFSHARPPREGRKVRFHVPRRARPTPCPSGCLGRSRRPARQQDSASWPYSSTSSSIDCSIADAVSNPLSCACWYWLSLSPRPHTTRRGAYLIFSNSLERFESSPKVFLIATLVSFRHFLNCSELRCCFNEGISSKRPRSFAAATVRFTGTDLPPT